MYLKQVLPLFAFAIAIGWFMPSDEGDNIVVPANESRPTQLIEAVETDDSDKDDVEQLLPERIVLERESDGHFYVDVDVNFGKARFLVDTGASMVALTGDDARELGLQWSEEDLQSVGRGASGDVRGKSVMIDRMQVGNFQASNVRAVIIPDGLDISLLGQSFLTRIGSVNIKDDKMVWN